MKIHFVDLNAINPNDLGKYFISKGWQPKKLQKHKIYSKNNHTLLIIDKSYSDYEDRLSETLSTFLCVEELTLPVQFQYNPKMPLSQYYIGIISGHDIQKLLEEN